MRIIAAKKYKQSMQLYIIYFSAKKKHSIFFKENNSLNKLSHMYAFKSYLNLITVKLYKRKEWISN